MPVFLHPTCTQEKANGDGGDWPVFQDDDDLVVLASPSGKSVRPSDESSAFELLTPEVSVTTSVVVSHKISNVSFRAAVEVREIEGRQVSNDVSASETASPAPLESDGGMRRLSHRSGASSFEAQPQKRTSMCGRLCLALDRMVSFLSERL
mmetsp:Transcript_27205/g.63343  ORF Transcript_27205/g.63343 Transcript_27205/m.63343 type:complete len:151 (+) Transcript_27205:95-547(+)